MRAAPTYDVRAARGAPPARPSPTFRTLVRLEVSRTFRLKRPWIGLAVLALIPVLITLSLDLRSRKPGLGDGPPFIFESLANGLFIPFVTLEILIDILLPAVVALVAADALAGETASGTLRALLARPVTRTSVLLSKWVLSGIYAALGLLVMAVVSLAVGGLVFGIRDVNTVVYGLVTVERGLGALGLAYLFAFVCMLGVIGIALTGLDADREPDRRLLRHGRRARGGEHPQGAAELRAHPARAHHGPLRDVAQDRAGAAGLRGVPARPGRAVPLRRRGARHRVVDVPPPRRPGVTDHGFDLDPEDERLLRSPPPPAALAWCAEAAGVDARVVRVAPLEGGTSSAVHAVDVETAGGDLRQLVLRRFVRADWLAEEPDLPRREAAALRAVAGSAVPTPELVALDPTGGRAGAPAVLMTRLDGAVVWRPAGLDPFVERLAALLPPVHATPLPAAGVLPGLRAVPAAAEPRA